MRAIECREAGPRTVVSASHGSTMAARQGWGQDGAKMGRRMKFSNLFSVICGFLLGVGASGAVAADRTMIVLDASGSMWGQIDGTNKIVIARDVLGEVLTELPEEAELGLIAYGHRRKGDCGDIERIAAPKPGTAEAIFDKVSRINPKGKTPLTEAVRQAAAELGAGSDAASGAVVLVTDGIETCDADPCALAQALAQSGVDLKVHVVGFGLTEEEGAQVACLAEGTGGQYFDAGNAEGLKEALGATVLPPVQEAVVIETPKPEAVPATTLSATASLSPNGPLLRDPGVSWTVRNVDTGKVADRERGAEPVFDVPAGVYDVTLRLGSWEFTQQLDVLADQDNAVHFDLDMARVTVVIFEGEDQVPSDERFRIEGVKGTALAGNSGETFYFPAGRTTVSAKKAAGVEVETEVMLKAGESRTVELSFAFGTVAPKVVWAENGTEVDARVMVKFAEAGSGAHVSQAVAGDSTELPAGSYIARAKLDGIAVEMPFVVAADEVVAPVIALNAAPVRFDVEGAGLARWAVLDATGEVVFSRRPGTAEVAMAAGGYALELRMEDGSQPHVPFEVIAGEALDVTP
ncbi:MAG: VWA domain-containing protein [Rhodobacteraceae bacterium]|nr:MAG: VWA domain-containing protein [Paracoccaceae bacterium]